MNNNVKQKKVYLKLKETRLQKLNDNPKQKPQI